MDHSHGLRFVRCSRIYFQYIKRALKCYSPRYILTVLYTWGRSESHTVRRVRPKKVNANRACKVHCRCALPTLRSLFLTVKEWMTAPV